MADLAEVFQTILGRAYDPRSQSYYELLALPRGESDRGLIEQQLKAIIRHLKETRETSPTSAWEQVVVHVQQVKRTLLDPTLKASYDAHLSPSQTPTRWPSGTPERPFDLASHQAALAKLPRESLDSKELQEANWQEFARSLNLKIEPNPS